MDAQATVHACMHAREGGRECAPAMHVCCGAVYNETQHVYDWYLSSQLVLGAGWCFGSQRSVLLVEATVGEGVCCSHGTLRGLRKTHESHQPMTQLCSTGTLHLGQMTLLVMLCWGDDLVCLLLWPRTHRVMQDTSKRASYCCSDYISSLGEGTGCDSSERGEGCRGAKEQEAKERTANM